MQLDYATWENGYRLSRASRRKWRCYAPLTGDPAHADNIGGDGGYTTRAGRIEKKSSQFRHMVIKCHWKKIVSLGRNTDGKQSFGDRAR